MELLSAARGFETKGAARIFQSGLAEARSRMSALRGEADKSGEAWLGPRHPHWLAQGYSRELACWHGFREQRTLGQIEAHLAHSKKICNSFHTFCDCACAITIGELEYSSAYGLFQSVVGATGDELSIDFKLDEGKVVKSHER